MAAGMALRRTHILTGEPPRLTVCATTFRHRLAAGREIQPGWVFFFQETHALASEGDRGGVMGEEGSGGRGGSVVVYRQEH